MYGDSTALSPDSSPIFSPNSKPKEEGFMDSNMNHFEYKQFQNNPINSGSLKFRSTPSSLLLNFVNGVDKGGDSNEGSLDHRALSPENQGLNPRFNSTSGVNRVVVSQSFEDLEDNKDLGNGYSLNSQFSSQFPIQCSNSMTVEHQGQAKMGSNLMRQSSSPAGFLSHLNSQNGYATMRGVGNYRLGNGANGDLSRSSSRLKAQMNFSSGVPSSLGMLTRISEIEVENVGASDPDDTKLENGNGDNQFYTSEYPFGSWNDSLHFAENFTSLKRELDDEGKLFPAAQNMELGNRTPILSHHLSLPNMGAMEKLLQFQDAVPCKIRAKRGCATHPRSIAERVRRTRISERMRKLQELVPNMDKQTNTADMLDLAVEYIKELQKQFKTLSDHRANCKCSGMLKPIPN